MKQKLLIVENEPSYSKLLETYFLSEGYDVVTADDGRAGIIMFNKQNIDLIITDVRMSGMGGMEMSERIRRKEKGKDVPIIALTGWSQVEINGVVNALFQKQDLLMQDLGKDVKELLSTHKQEKLEQIIEPSLREKVLKRDCIIDSFEESEEYVLVPLRIFADLNEHYPELLDEILPEKGFKDMNCKQKMMKMRKSPRVADYLVKLAGKTSEKIRSDLEENIMSSFVLNHANQYVSRVSLLSLDNVYRHQDVLNYSQRLAESKASHAEMRTFLTIMSIVAKSKSKGLPKEDVLVHGTIAGVGAMMADIGLDVKSNYSNSGTFVEEFKQHPFKGYNLFKETMIYPPALEMIRDHHKSLREWKSKYGEFTRLLQVAHDLVEIIAPLGVLWVGEKFELSMEPVSSLRTACEQMMYRAKVEKHYYVSDVMHLLEACGFSYLFTYGSFLEEIQESCKALRFNKTGPKAVSALCSDKSGKVRNYCGHKRDFSAVRLHKGQRLPGCLYYQDKLRKLNQRFKGSNTIDP